MKESIVAIPLDFEINPEMIGQGFTQSEMQTFDNCPEKWYQRYNLMLEKKGEFSPALMYGHWVHAYLEEWYSTKGKRAAWNPSLPTNVERRLTLDQRQEVEYWRQLGEMQMRIYSSYYKQDHKFITPVKGGVECIIEIPFTVGKTTFLLKGMIDLFAFLKGRNGYFCIDHKTSKRLDRSTILGWDFRFQFMFYCWLASKQWPDIKIKGFMPNGIKKSELKWNPEKETVEEHIQRVREDMLATPEKYFYREPLMLIKGQLKHFEETQLIPKLYRFMLFLDPKIPVETKIALTRNKNTDYCIKYGTNYACPYLPLCQRGPEVNGFQYSRREVKHAELEEE